MEPAEEAARGLPLRGVLLGALGLAALLGGTFAAAWLGHDGYQVTPRMRGPRFPSPDGARALQVVFHKGGRTEAAALHYAAVLDGASEEILVEGWVSLPVRLGEVPFPLAWDGEDAFRVELAAQRDGRATARRVVLPAR